MPLYKCQQCGTVENTALGDFWCSEKKLCSECSPSIKQWHGAFAKRNATELGYYRDKDGFIYHPSEVDTVKMEWTYNRDFKMVGLA